MKKNRHLLLLITMTVIITMSLCSCTAENVETDFDIYFSSYYVVGQNLDTVKGKVFFKNNAEKEITLKDCEVTGLDTSVVGIKEIVVKYKNMEKKYSLDIRKEYKVTFSAGDGGYVSGKAEQLVAEGADSLFVTAFANEGYAFADWSDGNTKAKRNASNVTAEVALVARFVPHLTFNHVRIHDIDFDASNFISSRFIKSTDKTVVTGSIIPLKPKMKSGFNFLGYVSDKMYAGIITDTVAKNFIPLIPKDVAEYTANLPLIDLYPVYVPNYYSLKFVDENGVCNYPDDLIKSESFSEYTKTVNLFALSQEWAKSYVDNLLPMGYEYEIVLKEGDSVAKITNTAKFTSYSLSNLDGTVIALKSNISSCSLSIWLDNGATPLYTNTYDYGVNKSFFDMWEIIRTNQFIVYQDNLKYSMSVDGYDGGKYFDKNEGENLSKSRIFSLTKDMKVTIKSQDIFYSLKVINTPALFENGENPNYDNSGVIYESKQIKYGLTFAKPSYKPIYNSNDVYMFYNYYSDEQCLQLFDFSAPIKADTNIYCGYYVKQTFDSAEKSAQLKYIRKTDNTSGFRMFSEKGDVLIKYGDKLEVDKKFYNALVKEGATLTSVELNPIATLTSKVFSEYRNGSGNGEAIDLYAAVRTRKSYFAMFDTAKCEIIPTVTIGGMPYAQGEIYLSCYKPGHATNSNATAFGQRLYYYPCTDTTCKTFILSQGILLSEYGSIFNAKFKSALGTVLEGVRIGGSLIAPTLVTKTTENGITCYTVKIDAKSPAIKDNLLKIEYVLKAENHNVTISEQNSSTKLFTKSSDGSLVEINKIGNVFTISYGSYIVLQITIDKGRALESIIIDGGMSVTDFIYDAENGFYVYNFGYLYKDTSMRMTSAMQKLNVELSSSGEGDSYYTDNNYLPISSTIFIYGSDIHFLFSPRKINGVLYRVESLYINETLRISNGSIINTSENIIFTASGEGYKLMLRAQTVAVTIRVTYAPKALTFSLNILNGGADTIIKSVLLGTNTIDVNSNSFTYDDAKYGKLIYGAPILIKYNVGKGYKTLEMMINGKIATSLPTTLTENMAVEVFCEIISYSVVLSTYGGNSDGNKCVLTDSNDKILSNNFSYTYSEIPLSFKIKLEINDFDGYEISLSKITKNGVESSLSFKGKVAEFTANNENVLVEIGIKLKEYAINFSISSSDDLGSIVVGDYDSQNIGKVDNIITIPQFMAQHGKSVSILFYLNGGTCVKNITVTNSDGTKVITDEAAIARLLQNFTYLKNVMSIQTISIELAHIRYSVSKGKVNSGEISAFDVKLNLDDGAEIIADLTKQYYYNTNFKIYITCVENYEVNSLTYDGMTYSPTQINGNVYVYSLAIQASGVINPIATKKIVTTTLDSSGLVNGAIDYATCKLTENGNEILPVGGKYTLYAATTYLLVITFNLTYGNEYSPLVQVNGENIKTTSSNIVTLNFTAISSATIVVGLKAKAYDIKISMLNMPQDATNSVTVMGNKLDVNGDYTVSADKASTVFMEIKGTSRIKITVDDTIIFDGVPNSIGNSIRITDGIAADMKITVEYY